MVHSRFRQWAAHGVTALRLGCTPALIACIWYAATVPWAGALAPVLFGIIATSDVVDGMIARRLGTASDAGRIFDHLADIIFLLSTFGTYTLLGIVPWWVPTSIAIAFSIYATNSWLRTTPPPPSPWSRTIGHLGGIANYVLIGTLVGNNTVGLHALSADVLWGMLLLVPLYSSAAILGHVVAIKR